MDDKSKSGMKPKLAQLSAIYTQEVDSCQSGNELMQLLEIGTQDGGDGIFYIIKTERWAFDKPDELQQIVADFRARLNEKPRKEK